MKMETLVLKGEIRKNIEEMIYLKDISSMGNVIVELKNK